jgi:hypothetical protein
MKIQPLITFLHARLALLFINRHGKLDRPGRSGLTEKFSAGVTAQTAHGTAMYCAKREVLLYVPIHGEGISVLVSDNPTGPYHDVLGKRLINSNIYGRILTQPFLLIPRGRLICIGKSPVMVC